MCVGKIRFYAAIFFLSFLCFNYFSSSTAATDSPGRSWVISEAVKDSIEPLKVEEFMGAFKALGLPASLVSYDQYLKGYQFLEGKFFSIYLAPVSHTANHIWILSHPSVTTSFENLTVDQLEELERFRYLVGEWYQKHIGCPSYAAFIDSQKKYGLGRPAVCLEMVPTPLAGQKKDMIDFSGKIERYSYLLYGNHCTHQTTLECAKEKRQNFLFFAHQFLHNKNVLNHPTITVNTLPWKQDATSLGQAQKLSLESVTTTLMQDHFLLFGQESKGAVSTNATKESDAKGEFTYGRQGIEIKKCAFCNPEIIKKQRVYTQGNVLCCYNYLPLSPTRDHFMILPQEHVENWQNISLKDSVELYSFAQIVVKAMQKDTNNHDIILYFQNTLAGGMTVPHIHMHVLRRPPAVYFYADLFTKLAGIKIAPLTAEDMAPRVKSMQEKILDLLPSSQ